jgi:predicted dinucleotide-binding enzyme
LSIGPLKTTVLIASDDADAKSLLADVVTVPGRSQVTVTGSTYPYVVVR